MTDRKIGNALKELGIFPSYKGYRYLIELIKLAHKQELKIGYMTKIGYPRTARLCQCTSEGVERSCRSAIATSYKHYEDVYYELLHLRHKPSTSEFIFTVEDYLTDKEEEIAE